MYLRALNTPFGGMRVWGSDLVPQCSSRATLFAYLGSFVSKI